MNPETLAWLFEKGTPALIFILIIINTIQSVVMRNLVNQIKDIKRGMIWNDKYESDYRDLDRRITRLEDKVNNKK